MLSLWFCVPVHGRLPLALICLRQLRRTCDALTEEGIEATAVVIADRENLDALPDLGFVTVERDNRFLSRRFNDGIQLACDPGYTDVPDANGVTRGAPADYVVPCGSDDWVDHRIFLELPPSNTVLGFQRLSFVRPDGEEITSTSVDYVGGCGIRVYPRQVVARLGYRPADEDRVRACDTSILVNTQKAYPDVKVEHREIDPRQIVDWKSENEQVTSYESIFARFRGDRQPDPFDVLADVYPAAALAEMQAHYMRELVAA